MNRKRKAFTLIELLVVIAIIALLISILLPSLSRARELSKRLVCGSNMKGIGTSAKIYANDHNERWMVPPFDDTLINEEGIDYVNNTNDTSDWQPSGGSSLDEGAVGWMREIETTSPFASDPGSPSCSSTRAFWILVRSGDVTVQQFVCPSSTDSQDETENLDLYYDFTGYTRISYGYQVPFGPRDTRPREGVDNRQILSADKGPYYLESQPDWNVGASNEPINLDDSPKAWRPFNSANHGGLGNGEGQNCLYGDGHASFQRTPAVGIDNDNIYTLMNELWSDPNGGNRIHGDTVFQFQGFPYPGQWAFNQSATGYASTDSLLYP